MSSLRSVAKICAMRAADIAGFGTVEAVGMATAMRRVIYVAAAGFAVASTAPWIGLPALAGVAVVAACGVVLAGGVLLAAQINEELAKLLAMPPAVEPIAEKPAPMVREAPPPMPLSAPARPVPRKAVQVLSRGDIEGRAYAVFTDGSIEIETIFGPRWFATVELAHEFIGYRKGGARPQPRVALAS
jgi:hypothetical protein